MNRLILCMCAVVTASFAADIDLSTRQCAPNVLTLPDLSGTLTIDNGTNTCDWKLAFSSQYHIKLEPELLCLSCDEVLKFRNENSAVLWDVDTIHQLNGGAPGEKVCNQQQTYCSHGGTRELRDQPPAITLQYERKGNVDVNLRFKYQLYAAPTTTPQPGASSKMTTSKMSSTTSGADKLGRSLATFLFTAYLLTG